MELINLSAELEGKLYSWIPHDLECEKIIFYPDACPGKSPLPTGTAVLTKSPNWRKFAISDIGCGMTLLKSNLKWEDFKTTDWDNLYTIMKNQKEGLGTLGSGNHFLDAIVSLSDETIHFVVHTGSRLEGKTVETLIDNPVAFDKEYESVVEWAKNNRLTIKGMIDKVFGKTELLMDKPHNTFSKMPSGEVLIRKGTVSLLEGETTLIPSNMDGEMVLVKGKAEINKYLNSISHGTGRVMSRSDAKKHAEDYDYDSLRKRIYIPGSISNDSIKTEAPFCYRDLNECMSLVSELVEEVERYMPIAYIGQL